MTEIAEPLIHMARTGRNRCFGCSPDNPHGLRLDFFLDPGGMVVCLPTVPDRFEGPPGHVHGGILATLLDEVMSKSVRSLGVRALTRQMEIDYLRPVPVETPLRVEGRMVRAEGRKYWTEARILSQENRILAQAKGLFVALRGNRRF
ncbi:MAG: PaaI family thioesterase [Terracidiphilus sp.]